MKNAIKTLMVLGLLNINLAWSTPIYEQNIFEFAIDKYHTTRQAGKTVNVSISYAYKNGIKTDEYPDYRAIRAEVLKFMEPTEALPATVYWEILAQQIGNQLLKDFPIKSIKVKLQVLEDLSSNDPDYLEPGDHGPTFIKGDIH